MKIYTSYFGNYRRFPSNMNPIAICAKPPQDFTGPCYKQLAPTYNTLMDYKNDGDANKFVQRYKEETLKKLNPVHVVNDMLNLIESNNILMLCYEKKGSFCHRHLVAEWLRKAGYEVEELD